MLASPESDFATIASTNAGQQDNIYASNKNKIKIKLLEIF